MLLKKPRLSFWQIINMNFGFSGLPYDIKGDQILLSNSNTIMDRTPQPYKAIIYDLK